MNRDYDVQYFVGCLMSGLCSRSQVAGRRCVRQEKSVAASC